jgi:hypothetical protein
MKKLPLALAVAGFTASLGAYAAIPTDAQPYQLVVPNLKAGIEVTLEGLYLQPSNSNLDYASVNQLTDIAFFDGFDFDAIEIDNQNNVQTVDPNYNFGFRVGLGYIFPNSGNDVQVNWTHFNHSHSNTTQAPDVSAIVTPNNHLTLVDPFLSDGLKRAALFLLNPVYDVAKVTGDAKFRLDSIDLDVGQFVDIGTRLRMRMFAGLRGAQVRNDQTTTVTAFGEFERFRGDDVIVVEYADQEVEQFDSKFTGIGPRFGVDSSYHIANCFGLIAHASVALLVGQTDSNTTSSNDFEATVFEVERRNGEIEDIDVFLVDVDNNINSDNNTRVVPALDGKLGFDYSYIFQNDSVLSLELGWQWTQYIDAVDKLTADVSGPIDLDFSNVTRTTSSVGFDGPYLTLNWKV